MSEIELKPLTVIVVINDQWIKKDWLEIKNSNPNFKFQI